MAIREPPDNQPTSINHQNLCDWSIYLILIPLDRYLSKVSNGSNGEAIGGRTKKLRGFWRTVRVLGRSARPRGPAGQASPCPCFQHLNVPFRPFFIISHFLFIPSILGRFSRSPTLPIPSFDPWVSLILHPSINSSPSSSSSSSISIWVLGWNFGGFWLSWVFVFCVLGLWLGCLWEGITGLGSSIACPLLEMPLKLGIAWSWWVFDLVD